MGIGFVIFIWLVFFGIIAVIFGLLKFFSKSFYIVDVIKDAFKAILGVFLLLIIVGISVNLIDFAIQNVYPPRIFSRTFGFSPTPEVKDLQGSVSLFSEYGFGKIVMRFNASKTTVEKIADERFFKKLTKKIGSNFKDKNLQEFATRENSQIYFASNFNHYCDEETSICATYLVHDEKSEEVYFIWF